MDWLHLGFVFSIVYALYMFQQIKITLKDTGHPVEPFTGWIGDFRRFKAMTETETDEQDKMKYQKILNGLYVALGGMAVIGALLLQRYLG